jgi:hypothetical protein
MLNNKLFNDSGRSSRLAMGKCREKNKAQVRTLPLLLRQIQDVY